MSAEKKQAPKKSDIPKKTVTRKKVPKKTKPKTSKSPTISKPKPPTKPKTLDKTKKTGKKITKSIEAPEEKVVIEAPEEIKSNIAHLGTSGHIPSAQIFKKYRDIVKSKTGHGFSKGELKELNLNFHKAKKIGLPIDLRRSTVHNININAIKNFLKNTTLT